MKITKSNCVLYIIIVLILLDMRDCLCATDSMALFKERFIELCRETNWSYNQIVCECIYITAMDSGIDFVRMTAYAYKRKKTIPLSTLHGNKFMPRLNDDCWNNPLKLTYGSDTSASLLPLKEQYVFPPGTVPTGKYYITFTNEKKQTVLFQSDSGHSGGSESVRMRVSRDNHLESVINLWFSIDPKVNKGKSTKLAGKRIPLKELSLRINAWQGGSNREIWKQISAYSGEDNYLLFDSVRVDTDGHMTVQGSIHCTMTSDGKTPLYGINDGKFSLILFSD